MNDPIGKVKKVGEKLDQEADKLVGKGESALASAKKSKWTAGFLTAAAVAVGTVAYLIIK